MTLHKWYTASSLLPQLRPSLPGALSSYILLVYCLAVCLFVFLFLGFGASLSLHLILQWTCGNNFTSGTVFFFFSEAILCWVPSGSGDVFFKISAVCCSSLLDGLRIWPTPIYRTGLDISVTCEGWNPVLFKILLLNGYITVQGNSFLARSILHILVYVSFAISAVLYYLKAWIPSHPRWADIGVWPFEVLHKNSVQRL